MGEAWEIVVLTRKAYAWHLSQGVKQYNQAVQIANHILARKQNVCATAGALMNKEVVWLI